MQVYKRQGRQTRGWLESQEKHSSQCPCTCLTTCNLDVSGSLQRLCAGNWFSLACVVFDAINPPCALNLSTSAASVGAADHASWAGTGGTPCGYADWPDGMLCRYAACYSLSMAISAGNCCAHLGNLYCLQAFFLCSIPCMLMSGRISCLWLLHYSCWRPISVSALGLVPLFIWLMPLQH